MRAPRPYRACHCRDRQTGQLLGKRCPLLGTKGHGAWYGRYDAQPGADGRRRQKRIGAFRTRTEAEEALADAVASASRGKARVVSGAGIDPAGYYVYLLWAVQDDDQPLYVGSSGNILARLGDHLGDSGKRGHVGWVTFHRCASEQAMLRREGELIRRYRPPWNRRIPPEPADAGRWSR
jgi:GIY-YIG catalytic domain/Arm DNA-binding domain